jgi:multiple sugar transport system permease protein
VAPAMVMLVAFHVVPIFHGLWLAFTDAGPMGGEWVGLRNFRLCFKSRIFWIGVKNTIRYTLIAAPVLAVLTFGTACISFGMGRRTQWFVRFAFYMPQTMSAAVMSLIWVWMFNPDGSINGLLKMIGIPAVNWLGSNPEAFWTIMIVLIIQGLGTPIVVFLGALTSVPVELYEAAGIDGCGPARQAWYITIPAIFPIFTLQVIGFFVGTVQLWALPHWMTGGGPNYGTYTLMYGMYREMAYFSEYGMSATYGLMITVVLVSLILLQKRLSRMVS